MHAAATLSGERWVDRETECTDEGGSDCTDPTPRVQRGHSRCPPGASTLLRAAAPPQSVSVAVGSLAGVDTAPPPCPSAPRRVPCTVQPIRAEAFPAAHRTRRRACRERQSEACPALGAAPAR